MVTIHVANPLHPVADAAMQVNGARRYGADEVRKRVLDDRLEAEGAGFRQWDAA